MPNFSFWGFHLPYERRYTFVVDRYNLMKYAYMSKSICFQIFFMIYYCVYNQVVLKTQNSLLASMILMYILLFHSFQHLDGMES